MTHVIESPSVNLDERDERARAAVKAFRQLQPTLSAFARVMTRNPKVRVEMKTQGAGGSSAATDGTRIFFMPPIELGDRTPHQRVLCDKRLDNGLHRCPACRKREDVLVKIYHEISHICYDSFANVSQFDVNEAIKRAVAEHGTVYAKRLEQAIGGMGSYLELASAISPYLKLIVNAYEDARIESSLFRARPGCRVMFEGTIADLWETGVPHPDGSRKFWHEYPLNTQACFVMYLMAAGYEWKSHVHPKVAADLGDDATLNELAVKVRHARSVAAVNELGFKALARLRELGYCRSDREPENVKDEPQPPEQPPEEEPNEDPGSDGDDEANETGEPDPDTGSDGGQSDSSGDNDDAESDESSDGETGGSEESADGASDEGSNESDAGSPSDADSSSSDADDEAVSDSEAGDEGDSGADASEGSNGTTDGEVDDADTESVEDAGASESGTEPDGTDESDSSGLSDADEPADPADEAESDDADSGSASGDSNETSSEASDPGGDEVTQGEPGGDGGTDNGDQTSDGGTGDADGDAASDAGDNSSVQEPTGLGAEGDTATESSEGESPDGDTSDEGSADSSIDGSSESGPNLGGSEPPTSGDLGSPQGEVEESDRHSSPLTEGELDEDGVIDTGADEGEGGVEVVNKNPENTPVPEHGDEEDAETALLKWLDHEEKPDTVETQANETAIDKAIVQGLYFETPSVNVYGVREHRFETDDPDADAWDGTRYRGFDGVATGIDADMDVPESLLGAALLRMRVAFSDNQRGKNVRNLKSGKINKRALGKRAWGDDERLFRRKIQPGKKNYFVLIMMDISGSTVGRNIAIMKHAVMVQATLLDRMGIDFAIYAQTANSHTGTLGDYSLDMDIYVIKEKNQPWDPKAQRALSTIGPDSGNLDGHALEYARKRVSEVHATDRIILYYSDGKMPAANHDEELVILQREIRHCKSHGIILLGVGIRTDSPSQHGLETVQLDSVNDTPRVVDQLGRHILAAR